MPRRKNHHRSGFSLVEIAVVLGVVGVITAAIWGVMSTTREAAAANTIIQQIMVTTRNVRDYFSGRQLPSSVVDATTNYTNAVMRAAGVFPAEMCPANCVAGTVTTIYNSYGGTTTFSLPSAMGTIFANQFQLVFTNITQRGCQQMSTILTNHSNEYGLVSLKVGGGLAVTAFPISPEDMEVACTNSDIMSMTLVFKIRNQ